MPFAHGDETTLPEKTKRQLKAGGEYLLLLSAVSAILICHLRLRDERELSVTKLFEAPGYEQGGCEYKSHSHPFKVTSG